MTPEQLADLRDRIALARKPEHKLDDARSYNRGWNEAIAYVEKAFKEVLGEKS